MKFKQIAYLYCDRGNRLEQSRHVTLPCFEQSKRNTKQIKNDFSNLGPKPQQTEVDHLLNHWLSHDRWIHHVNISILLHQIGVLNKTTRISIPDQYFQKIVDVLNQANRLNTQDIGMILYGLQGTGNTVENTKLIRLLTSKIRNISYFVGHNISTALYGLQNMPASPEINQLIDAFASKIHFVSDFNGQNIGNALYGLQNMSASPEINQLIGALASRIH
ncbi:hypothetical protein EBR96_10980, partial [bacterium]|nr:hypothetical protein [bacterium]